MAKLWTLYIILQVLSAGHINYQQSIGCYEINPVYGKHPTKTQVYMVKGLNTLAVYGATKMFPKYEKHILAGVIGVDIAFMARDSAHGIAFKFRY